MVYGLLRALPGDQACLTPSPTDNSAGLTPTLRRQDHTTWPPARKCSRPKHRLRHRIPAPCVRDEKRTPLSSWAGTAIRYFCFSALSSLNYVIQNILSRTSFRDGSKDQTRNLEITLRVPRNDGAAFNKKGAAGLLPSRPDFCTRWSRR